MQPPTPTPNLNMAIAMATTNSHVPCVSAPPPVMYPRTGTIPPAPVPMPLMHVNVPPPLKRPRMEQAISSAWKPTVGAGSRKQSNLVSLVTMMPKPSTQASVKTAQPAASAKQAAEAAVSDSVCAAAEPSSDGTASLMPSSRAASNCVQRLDENMKDLLVCGRCRELFDNIDLLISHKSVGCRLRHSCRCKQAGEPQHLDCAFCTKSFLCSWELVQHCHTDHELTICRVNTGDYTNSSTKSDTDTGVVEPAPEERTSDVTQLDDGEEHIPAQMEEVPTDHGEPEQVDLDTASPEPAEEDLELQIAIDICDTDDVSHQDEVSGDNCETNEELQEQADLEIASPGPAEEVQDLETESPGPAEEDQELETVIEKSDTDEVSHQDEVAEDDRETNEELQEQDRDGAEEKCEDVILVE